MKQFTVVVILMILAVTASAQEANPLTLDEAIARALEMNGDIVVERDTLFTSLMNKEVRNENDSCWTARRRDDRTRRLQ